MRFLATVLAILIILLIAFPIGFAMAGGGTCPDCHGAPAPVLTLCFAVLTALLFYVMTSWSRLVTASGPALTTGFCRTIQRPPQIL